MGRWHGEDAEERPGDGSSRPSRWEEEGTWSNFDFEEGR